MAEHPEDRTRPLGDPESDEDISELQARLNDLQRSVELLGTQGVWASRGADEAVPAPQQPPVAPPYRPPDPAEPVPPTPYVPPSTHAQPQAPAQPAGVPPVEPAPTVPAPAATNGHTEEEPGISGTTATVAMVDAGPFADLIELRHFEDDLSSLTAVHDVRVRRFGQSRATIEVGMAGPYDLALELPRLGLPMRVSAGGAEELVVEFAPLPVPDADVEAPTPSEDEPGQGPV